MPRQNSTTVSNSRLNARLTQGGYKGALREIHRLKQGIRDCEEFIMLLIRAHDGRTDSTGARMAKNCIAQLDSPLQTLHAILEPLPVSEDSHD